MSPFPVPVISAVDAVYYSWDAQGRMSTAEPISGMMNFTYNADGQRVAKESTDNSVTGFLYDFKKVLHETDQVGGEITNTYTATSDQGYGDLISEFGSELYHQFDAQANTNALLDPAGDVQAQYKYYAFGQVAGVSVMGEAWTTLTVPEWATMSVDAWGTLPLISTQLGMSGQKMYYLDPETQLYLLGSGTNGRYYDPNTARFLSEDPIRQSQGDPNLFVYVQNNPINRLDPSGHDDSKQDDEKKKEDQRRDQEHRQQQTNQDQQRRQHQNESTARNAKQKQDSTATPKSTTQQASQNRQNDRKNTSKEEEFRRRMAALDPKKVPEGGDARSYVLNEIANEKIAEAEQRLGHKLSPSDRASWIAAVDQAYGHYAEKLYNPRGGEYTSPASINRVAGAGQAVGAGIFGYLFAPAAITPPGAVLVGTLLDYAQAGARQAVTGKETETILSPQDRDLLAGGAMGSFGGGEFSTGGDEAAPAVGEGPTVSSGGGGEANASGGGGLSVAQGPTGNVTVSQPDVSPGTTPEPIVSNAPANQPANAPAAPTSATPAAANVPSAKTPEVVTPESTPTPAPQSTGTPAQIAEGPSVATTEVPSKPVEPLGPAAPPAAGNVGASPKETPTGTSSKLPEGPLEPQALVKPGPLGPPAPNTTVKTNLPEPTVTNPKLGNIVKDLYKGAKTKEPIGTGSTADAIRHEMATGEKVGGRFHTQKGQEYARALQKWLEKNPSASPTDRATAQQLLSDFQSALGGDK